MSSKWNPWDFFKNYPKDLGAADLSVSAVSFFDPFVEELFKSRLKDKVGRQKELRLYLGSEVTLDWWESEWKTLDLFASDTFYLIINSSEISKATQAGILADLEQTEGSSGGKEICFCFSGAHSFFDALTKSKKVESHKVEPPKFWEWNKYLVFLAESKGFPLGYETEQFLLDVLNPSGEEFARAIDILKLTFKSPTDITRDHLVKLFQNEHLDYFKLAGFFGSKAFSKFYEEILPFSSDLETMRSLGSFMQSHLLKVLDPSYTEKKNRLTKYDQEVLAHNRRWKPRELMLAIRFFGNLEQMAKEGSPLLAQTLRTKYFEVLSPLRTL